MSVRKGAIARIAVIDLGTNSVRFDVHQIGPRNQVRSLHREKIMVRLGQGVFLTGQLDRGAVKRTVHAFRSFQRICKSLKVEKIVAFGTSALREAADSEKFVRMVRDATGIEIRVITGKEEARLIAKGVLAHHDKRSKNGFKRVGLVDIGGGSTEISVCSQKKILWSESLPLGTARLQQVFLKTIPPTKDNVERLRRFIREELKSFVSPHAWRGVDEFIGSSGTIRAVGKILRRREKSKTIKRGDLEELVERMRKMGATQILAIAGMETKRVDMILAGAILLEECMSALGCKEISPTELSLRDGILEEQLELVEKHEISTLALHVDDLYERAEGLGQSRSRLERTVRNAERLFDSLSGVHKLDRSWRLHLVAATILRNVGESVSILGHPQHSSYILRNSHFPFIDEWELELVAGLCEHHENNKLEEVEDVLAGNPRLQRIFRKLLGLLLVTDSIDVDPRMKVTLEKARVERRRLEISLGGRETTGLEKVRLEQRQDLIRALLGRTVEFQ